MTINNDFNLLYIMAIQIKNDNNKHIFAVGAKLPIDIGCNVKPCPVCGAVMSFAYDRYFCRRCDYPAGQEEES